MYLFQIYLVTIETFEFKEADVRCQVWSTPHLTNKKWKPCAREVHAQLFQDSNERTDAHSCLGLRRAFAEEAKPRTYGEFFFFAKRGLFSHSSEMMRETSLVLFFLPLLSKMKHISICFTVN